MKYVVSNYLTLHICTNENAASVLKTIQDAPSRKFSVPYINVLEVPCRISYKMYSVPYQASVQLILSDGEHKDISIKLGVQIIHFRSKAKAKGDLFQFKNKPSIRTPQFYAYCSKK